MWMSLAVSFAMAGECVRPPFETNPEVLARFARAVKESAAAPSRIYQNEFGRWSSDGAPKVEGIWLSSGEPKCGQSSPYRRIEAVTTERLKADYTDYVKKDLRIWITDPSGRSAILSEPDELLLPFEQSIYSCVQDGPLGFSCPAKLDRKRCCRRKLEKALLFEATYSHPFLPEMKIRVRNDRSMESVSIVDAQGRQKPLVCNTFRRFPVEP